jgi:HSP20 family molecular chaperone IbpA
MFSRTIWLPRPVDPNKVSAKLQDGILTLTIPKAEDKGSVKVDVE